MEPAEENNGGGGKTGSLISKRLGSRPALQGAEPGTQFSPSSGLSLDVCSSCTREWQTPEDEDGICSCRQSRARGSDIQDPHGALAVWWAEF